MNRNRGMPQPAPASSPRRDGSVTAWQVSCRSADPSPELSFDTAPLPPSSTKKRCRGRRKYGRRSWLDSPAGATYYRVFSDFGGGKDQAWPVARGCQGAEGSCRSSHAEQSPPSAPLYPGANSFAAQQYCSHPRRWDRGFESRLLQQRVSNELFLAVFTIATTLTPAFGFRRKARPHRGHRDYIPLRR